MSVKASNNIFSPPPKKTTFKGNIQTCFLKSLFCHAYAFYQFSKMSHCSNIHMCILLNKRISGVDVFNGSGS